VVPQKELSETLSLADNYSGQHEESPSEDYEEELTETINLTDNIYKDIDKLLLETSTIKLTDEISNAFSRELTETLIVLDGDSKGFGTILSETINLTDNVYKNLHEYSGGSSLFYNGSSWVEYSESDTYFTITGFPSKKEVFIDVERSISDTVNLSDTLDIDYTRPARAWEVNLYETISITHNYLYRREFSETLAITDGETYNANAVLEETLALSDSLYKSISRILLAIAQETSDTELKSPTATGEDYNEWANPTNAYSSDDTYATAQSGEDQDYYNFDFDIPDSSIIEGIEVQVEVR